MQVCTSLQTDNHASTPPLSFLQAGCPSCHPTNSIKALKAWATKACIMYKMYKCKISLLIMKPIKFTSCMPLLIWISEKMLEFSLMVLSTPSPYRLHGLCTSSPLIFLANTRCSTHAYHSLGDRSFAVTGPCVWNSLPATMIQITSYRQHRDMWKHIYSGPRNHSTLWLLIIVHYTNTLTYLPSSIESRITKTWIRTNQKLSVISADKMRSISTSSSRSNDMW